MAPANAILDDKTRTARLADETRKALRANGKKEALYEAYTAGEKDYTALVSKLKQNGVDVVYLGGYHTEAGLIVLNAGAGHEDPDGLGRRPGDTGVLGDYRRRGRGR